MDGGTPTIVVRKGGFLTALVSGIFSLAITIVICASLLAGYALHVVNIKSDSLVDMVTQVVSSVPEITEALPPIFAEALHDRRAPDTDIAVDARLVSIEGRSGVAISIRNRGRDDLSLLTLDVVIRENGVPIENFRTHAVTPLALGEWRGPLPRGRERAYTHWLRHPRGASEKLTIDATPIEVRVLVTPETEDSRSASAATGVGHSESSAMPDQLARALPPSER